MPQPRQVQVAIFGRTYTLSGADPDHIRKIARLVNDTMMRFSNNAPDSGNYEVAILAALHLADELATVRQEYEEYRSRVDNTAMRALGVIESGLDTDDGSSAAGS